MPDRRLTILPSVPVWTDGKQLVLDRKFHDGVLRYVERWPGPVRCLLRRADGPLPAFGALRVRADAQPFAVEILERDERIAARHLAGTAVVLAAADDHLQLPVGALAHRLGIRCVQIIEYIPQTRHQIVALESGNPLVRLRRDLFLRRAERQRRRALARADGIQANGTAAWEQYREFANCLLYFDTRLADDAMIGPEALERRLATAAQRRTLRLAFSGRLIAMKGADHLLRVASLLRDAGTDFHLTIYGTGDLEQPMRAEIGARSLAAQVTMRGAVDFHATLVPEISAGIDVYVMPHRQSDPSCTYLETLSCGIPIVGYANRALAGILARADAGIGVAMDDVAGVAAAIRQFDADRALLARQSRNAVVFARPHSFEQTFRRRVDHLLQVAGAAPAGAALAA